MGNHFVEHLREDLELALPANQPSRVPEPLGPGSPARRDDLPDGDRLRLALGLNPRPGAVVDLETRSAVRSLVDENPVHGRGGLYPRGGIDDVAVRHGGALVRARVERHHRLARGDTDSNLEPARAFVVVKAADCLAHRVSGANGSLRVVLVRDGRAEESHGGIADELLDGASVALELLTHGHVVGIDDAADVLGVELFGKRCEPDDVDEDDADDLPLERDLGRLDLRAAGGAVRQAGRQRPEAARRARPLERLAAAPAIDRVPRVHEAARGTAGTHRATPCRRLRLYHA